MPTPTYTPLANITLGSSAASVTFSSISQAYRDLVLVVTGWVTTSTGQYMTINNDTGANYSVTGAFGSGSSTGAGNSTSREFNRAINFDTDSTKPSVATIQIFDYSATDKHKSSLVRMNAPAVGTEMLALRWASTSAITNLKLEAVSTTWGAGTSFALYGIAA